MPALNEQDPIADPAPSIDSPYGVVSLLVAALKANWLPALVLCVVALSILLCYEFVEPIHDGLEAFSVWVTHYGIYYGAVSTALFMGLIPLLVDQLKPRDREPLNLATLTFFMIFWGLKGVEIVYLYRLQTWMFGGESDVWTLLCKTIFDLLVYVPFYAFPILVLCYQWKDAGFRFRTVKPDLNRSWYGRRVFPVMVTNWAVWLPVIPMIYAMPLALQLPLQNIMGCFFALLLLFITRHTVSQPNPIRSNVETPVE